MIPFEFSATCFQNLGSVPNGLKHVMNARFASCSRGRSSLRPLKQNLDLRLMLLSLCLPSCRGCGFMYERNDVFAYGCISGAVGS